MAKESGSQEEKGMVIDGANPVEHDDSRSTHYLEIVWSSPVFTDSSQPVPENNDQPPSGKAIPRKYVHAFESDFLDSAAFSWDLSYDEEETVEDHGHLVAQSLSRTSSSDLRLIDIYPAVKERHESDDQTTDSRTPELTAVRINFDSPKMDETDAAGEPSTGQEGEDWRPQGMVFFETVSLRPRPPRRVVYSSSEPVQVPPAAKKAPVVEPPPAIEVEPVHYPETLSSPEEIAVREATKPFFEIPDYLPPMVAEDTAEIHPVQVKTKGLFARILNVISWCVLLTFFVSVAVSILYVRYARQRLYENQAGSGRIVDLVVQPGDTFRAVADKLDQEGLFGRYMGISDWYLLRYLAHVNENSNQLKPGAYRLNSNLGLNEIYNRLIQGSHDFKITIPEGKTAREIATQVARRYDTFDSGRFMELVNDQAFIGRLGLNVPSLEGYLYPSTYFYGPGMKEEDLIRLMVTTFRQSVEGKLKGLPKTDELSFHEHVIMASLIEKEARMEEDRPLIASVIHNRLKRGMLLQIDATVNYALDEWRRLNYEDLKIDSPYNTYKVKGLPPGPICSPRAASVVATFNAPQTDYLYYVYKGDGRHAFSASYEEFLTNKRQYLKSQVAPIPESPELEANAADAVTSRSTAGTAVARSKPARK